MSDVNDAKKVIAALSSLAEEHGELFDIVETLFNATCNAYSVGTTPEECAKAIEALRPRMMKIVMPDFDDSE